MRRVLTDFVSVLFSFFRFFLTKLLHPCGLSFQPVERFSPNVVVEIERGGMIKLGKRVRAHSGCIFKVRKGAKLIIGDDVSFNYNCMVYCKESVVIEKGVEFGPNVMIYDHDHDFKCEKGIKAKKFITSPVKIEKNGWIGCNTIILRGTTIGENAVIGAGSVVKGNVPANSVLVQKRDEEIIKIDRGENA